MWNRLFGASPSEATHMAFNSAATTTTPYTHQELSPQAHRPPCTSIVRCSNCGSLQPSSTDTGRDGDAPLLFRCEHCDNMAWMQPSSAGARHHTVGARTPSPTPNAAGGNGALLWQQQSRDDWSPAAAAGDAGSHRRTPSRGVVPPSPSSSSIIISSPSIVFRSCTAASSRRAEATVDGGATRQRGFDDGFRDYRQKNKAMPSSVDKILALLSPARHSQTAAWRGPATTTTSTNVIAVALGHNSSAARRGNISPDAGAALLEQARMLLCTNRERLAFRYFQSWAIFSAQRQRRSVLLGSGSASPARSSARTVTEVRNARVMGAPDDNVLEVAVASIWRAHEEHTERIQTVLEELRNASTTAQRHHDADTATGMGGSMNGPQSPVQSRDGSSMSPLKAQQHQRPLSALVQAQGAQARTLLPRQEDMHRRKLYQQELEEREANELNFHADRGAAAQSIGGGSRDAMLRHGSVVSAMIQQYNNSSTDRVDVARQERGDRLAAIGSAARTSAQLREMELDVARIVAREQTGRRVTDAAQSNAWTTLVGSLEAAYSAACFEDADAQIRHRLHRGVSGVPPGGTPTRQQAYGSSNDRSGSILLTSPSTAASSQAGNHNAASSPSLRQRAASAVRFESNDASTAVGRGGSIGSGSPVVAGGSPRPRSGTAVVTTTTMMPPNSIRSTSTVGGSPPPPAAAPEDAASSRRRAQSMPTAGGTRPEGEETPVGRLQASELKGRKAVIRLYKTDLEQVIALFAARAAAMHSS